MLWVCERKDLPVIDPKRPYYAQRRPCLQVLVVDGKPHMILLEKLVVLLRLNKSKVHQGG